MLNQCQYPSSNGNPYVIGNERLVRRGVMARDGKKKETDEQPEVTTKGSCSDSDPSITAALPAVQAKITVLASTVLIMMI